MNVNGQVLSLHVVAANAHTYVGHSTTDINNHGQCTADIKDSSEPTCFE